MMGEVAVWLTVVATALLVFAALHDLAVRTVPNWLSVAVLFLGLGLRLLDHSLFVGMAVAAVSFVLLFGLWVVGAMGGGDVKLWAATVMLIPPGVMTDLDFFTRVIVLGGLLAIVYLLLSLVVPKPPVGKPAGYLPRFWRTELRRIGRRGPLPYACAISAGALTVLLPHSFPC